VRLYYSITIDKNYFYELDPYNRSALILHEVAYALAPIQENGMALDAAEQSTRARQLIGYMHSQKFVDFGFFDILAPDQSVFGYSPAMTLARGTDGVQAWPGGIYWDFEILTQTETDGLVRQNPAYLVRTHSEAFLSTYTRQVCQGVQKGSVVEPSASAQIATIRFDTYMRTDGAQVVHLRIDMRSGYPSYSTQPALDHFKETPIVVSSFSQCLQAVRERILFKVRQYSL
jgi:hypothetical protein